MTKFITRQTMIENARASARKTDGAPNLVILNGESGSIAGTSSRIRYLNDGYIEVSACNSSDASLWKKISTIELMPGKYTLTGLTDLGENTIELLLSIEIDNEHKRYFSQYNGETSFETSEK